jgi:hypothetical protein
MGSGEDILVDLIGFLQETPPNSLVVIEEIECGLHPEAICRLAKHMQEIILEKHLQVIVSTHSSYFIDAVPRQARILIQRLGNQHQAIPGPTTRYAVGLMAGKPAHEADVLCEDSFAEELIRSALIPDLRRRCAVTPIGGKSELCSAAWAHVKLTPSKHLIVWDGDVPNDKIKGWIAAIRNREAPNAFDLNWIKLPGDVPPGKVDR